MITIEQLKRMFPKLADDKIIEFYGVFTKIFPKYELNSRIRILYFITQTAFETQMFTKFKENLYYTSPQRLVTVWSSRFNLTGTGGKANANNYVKNPVKLANLVYANRMGNGNEASGDGGKYIGRGAIHITGKYNYSLASKDLYNDNSLIDNPDLVSDNSYIGFDVAGWFWKKNNLNKYSDERKFTLMTKVINGSDSTAPERKKLLNQLAAKYDNI